ncbi:hypothetical protein FRB96_006318 [Tulasnella sp. 330]|nr:hypothetical protein FRB96_006318 [Tulasnella sp. 330]KAG8885072.1 hypothetical protein FRB97_002237 [Tulasnella sp. 331]KAG8890639.1 hypothetical protein FRB98_007194 [Tulasnella sp. 332]
MAPNQVARRGYSSLQRRADSGIQVGKWVYLSTLNPQEVKLVWTYNSNSPATFALYFWKVNAGSAHTYILARDNITTKVADPTQTASDIRIIINQVKGVVVGDHYKPVLAQSGVSPSSWNKPPTNIYDVGSLSFVYDPSQTTRR